MQRVPPTTPLSPMQTIVAELVGIGQDYATIGEALGIKPETVREYMQTAAAKLPGDLPPKLRVMAWVRGATLDVLVGMSLKMDVVEKANRRSWRSLTPTKR